MRIRGPFAVSTGDPPQLLHCYWTSMVCRNLCSHEGLYDFVPRMYCYRFCSIVGVEYGGFGRIAFARKHYFIDWCCLGSAASLGFGDCMTLSHVLHLHRFHITSFHPLPPLHTDLTLSIAAHALMTKLISLDFSQLFFDNLL